MLLTEVQIKRKVQAKTKAWLKMNNFTDLKVRCTRGIFIIDNCGNYLLSAMEILEIATGLQFNQITNSTAKLKPTE